MKKWGLGTMGVVLAILIVVAVLASGVLAQGGDSGGTVLPDKVSLGNDSNPAGPAEIVIPERYRAQPGSRTAQAGTTIVWFTPQDEDASTTVIFFYNTGDVAGTVTIETFDIDGAPEIHTDVAVPAHWMVRICADEVSTIASTWQDAAWVNFQTWST